MGSLDPSRLLFDTFETRRVGVVGAGGISTRVHLPLLHQMPDTTVAYVADIDQTKATQVATRYDCDSISVGDDPDVLPEADVVLLAIPVGVRRPYIEALAERGTPVFAEKPFAKGLEEHDDYIERLPIVACNYMRCWFNSTRQLRIIVESGLLGALREVRIRNGMLGGIGIGPDSYRNDPELAGGGVLMESGCHTLSQLAFILDQFNLGVGYSSLSHHDGLDVDVEARIESDSGVVIEYQLSRIRSSPTESTFRFENGTVQFDHTSAGGCVSLRSRNGDARLGLKPDRAANSFQQAVLLRWREFLRMVQNPKSVDINYLTSRRTTELIDQIYAKATSSGANQ